MQKELAATEVGAVATFLCSPLASAGEPPPRPPGCPPPTAPRIRARARHRHPAGRGSCGHCLLRLPLGLAILWRMLR